MLSALILCGGQSTRMGRPKAWLPFGPELLLQRVVRLVGEAIGDGPIVVVAAPGQDIPALNSSIAIARDPAEKRGPLQGLAAGMAALPESAELVYVSPVDAPFLNPRWITRLAALIGDHAIAMPYLGGYHHPLCALYRRSAVLPVMQALLAADRLRPVFLMEQLPTRILEVDDLRPADPSFGTIRNMNTPADYEKALADAGFAPAPSS